MFFFHDFRATYERTIVFLTSVLAFIKVIYAKSKSISWDQRQPGFYLRIWTLFFFFFQKNLLYEDDGIL